jgi:hypothetical protein
MSTSLHLLAVHMLCRMLTKEGLIVQQASFIIARVNRLIHLVIMRYTRRAIVDGIHFGARRLSSQALSVSPGLAVRPNMPGECGIAY